MDQGLGEDTVQLDAENDAHVQYKYSEHSLKPENCETLESQEEALQHSPGSPECSFDVIADILGGKNVENETDKLCSSPNVIEDAGDMVEELTVQNCDGSNIAIVGTSNDREKIQHQQKQFRNVFQLVGGSKVMGSSGRLNINSTASNLQAETSNRSFPEFSAQKSITSDHIEAKEQLESFDRNALSDETLSSGGIKTKILSKSGFSKFFVKTTLKGKGIICNGPPQDKLRARSIEQKSVGATSDPKLASNASIKIFGGSLVAPSDASLSLQALTSKQPSLHVAVAAERHRANESEGLSLREWLKSEHHKINKTECLYVFRQIVDLVDHSHSQGVVLYDLTPSCFKMLKANRVRYTGSSFQRDTFNPENPLSRKRQPSTTCLSLKKQKLSDNANFSQWPLFRRASIKTGTKNVNDVNVSGTLYSNGRSGQERLDTADHPFGSMIELSEQKWYASPEELGGEICTMHTNVFKLGILLFELLARFGSERAHAAAMSDLRHRILPPSFLSENPREAGFCLWLLHPEPSCRPTTRDIMQSEVVNGIQEMFAKELSSSIEKEDTESELLLHFLSSLQEHKEKHASNLRTDILCLEDDIKEVEKRRSVMKPSEPTSGGVSCPSLLSNLPGTRLFKNINQLESVYFSMRTNVNSPEIHRMMRPDIDLLRNGDNYHSEQDNLDTINSSDRVGAFFDGLCKYARYSKFEMRGLLRTGEFSNSANVICSLSFDRDEDYFAAAGISKKIKVYEFGSIFHDSVDIHYPAIEMPNRSRLSGVCWNNYIKNYLASSDYDGIVKLWDVTTGQAILQLSEHVKRAWSVDFSQLYPTKLASGSDDCTVKLWNINERNCSGTIRNIANVCCVQFSPHSTNLVAFGSADYRTYCYDLRNLRVPWCILTGHDKAVSYVKFLDHETLITASTDNTLKLWDLKKTTHGGLSTNACSLTFRGHTNEKNFVGLSVKDGYVACGSETNEVYGYHRSLPMPVTSYKFGSIDPVTGRETDDDNGQFVSSVCWRQKSDMVLAANSSGCIKVLQMV